MNKIHLFLAAAAASAGVAFAEAPSVQSGATAANRVKIVATTFPVYDWTRAILGDRVDQVDLVLLQQSGVDLHSYSPTASDLRTIVSCDLFLFVGGESDEWAERALALEGANPKRQSLNLIKSLGRAAKEEKIVEGMEHSHHHNDDAHKGHEHHHHDHEVEHEIDEHVWLSLRHASTLVKAIAAELASIDPANAATYRSNAAAYCDKLSALDRAYSEAVGSASRKTILVADRFPFRYLADDYGLEYYAAFAGCSAESEASFKTIMFLAKKVNEHDLPVILTIEGARHKIAETVRRTTRKRNQRILTLDSLQSTTGEEARTARYLDVMERNLDVLKEALN